MFLTFSICTLFCVIFTLILKLLLRSGILCACIYKNLSSIAPFLVLHTADSDCFKLARSARLLFSVLAISELTPSVQNTLFHSNLPVSLSSIAWNLTPFRVNDTWHWFPLRHTSNRGLETILPLSLLSAQSLIISTHLEAHFQPICAD